MKLYYIYEQIKHAQSYQELNEGLISDWINDFSNTAKNIKDKPSITNIINGLKKGASVTFLILGLCIFGVINCRNIKGENSEKIKNYLMEQTHSQTTEDANKALQAMPLENRKILFKKAIKDFKIHGDVFDKSARELLKHELGLPHIHINAPKTQVVATTSGFQFGTPTEGDTHHYEGFHDDEKIERLRKELDEE